MVWWLWLIGGALVGAAAASGSSEPKSQIQPSPRPDYYPQRVNNHFQKNEVHLHRTTYVQVNNYYNNGHRTSSTRFTSENRSAAFGEWRSHDEELGNHVAAMNRLYSETKRPGLAPGQRQAMHNRLQEMKREKEQIQARKRDAHDRWKWG